MNPPRLRYLVFLLALSCVPPVSADTVTIPASRDTTLFQDQFNNSDGGGPSVYAGTNGSASPRRALLYFDVAKNIPRGAAITGAQLTLTLAQVAGSGGGSGGSGGGLPQIIRLFALTQNWAEGTNGSGSTIMMSGGGFAAAPGDATWNARIYSSTSPTLWTAPGGDFIATPSATLTVSGTTVGTTDTWSSTPQLVADVQNWYNNPAANFGWVLKNDDEVSAKTYYAFYSREGASPATAAPQLTVTYTPPPSISLQTISSGQLVSPVYITNAGDGSNRLFVCDQVGKIRVIQDRMLLPTPFLDLSAKLVPQISSYDETGLLCMAFHPGFSNPSSPGYQKFYVFYSAPSPNAVGNSSISGIAATNPCTITTPAPHGLTTNATVAITGVTGSTFTPTINATYAVTVIDATHFTVPVSCSSTVGVGFSSAQVLATNPVYCRSTISEFQISPGNSNVADPGTERVVLAYDKPQNNHNGSQLAFGPDGYLYISAGDGGSQHDNDYGHTGGVASAAIKSGNLGNAQDKTKLLGKIMRIDPFGNNGPGGTYGIPATNPFVGAGGGVREEIYTFGHRNPWRFCFDTDPTLGSRIIEADVGQNDVEEINLLTPGGNYGWRIMEGAFAHDSTAPSGGGTPINPVTQYFHPTPSVGFPSNFPKIGTSIIGGYVYRGTAIPSLVGQYIFADWSPVFGTPTGVLLALDSTTWAMSQSAIIGTIPSYITSFGVDESGEIYVATKVATGPVNTPATSQPGGGIYKIVPPQVGQINFATLTPAQNNSVFSDATTSSDALGYLYSGETATTGILRRGLLAFDIAGQLPAGAVATSAQLMLNMNSTAALASARMSLFKITESWGQGASGPSSGGGSPATTGDATWADRLYDPTTPALWTTAGGTHATATSASNPTVGVAPGYYTWSATSQMMGDIQNWLNTPSTNNGWLLVGAETTKSSVRRFDSMTSAPNLKPALQVTYLTAGQLTWRQTWLQQYFTPVGTYVNDQTDSTGDGLNNLLDYAYGYSPLVANRGYAQGIASPPIAGMQTSLTSSGGNDTYTMTFLRDPRATDLTYQLQSSDDLVLWTTITQSTGGGVPTGSAYVSDIVSPVAAPVRVVTAVETLPAPAKHFARVVVTRASQQ